MLISFVNGQTNTIHVKELLITSFDSLKNHNVIYLKDSLTQYKIISKKKLNAKCPQIKVGEKYLFELKSIFYLELKDGETVYNVSNMVNIHCIALDEFDKACKEENIGIFDVYETANLEGLCYVTKPASNTH